jgi:AmmeMemoRadiSam system protein B/AmmeMemoRadiSam system protein A
MRSLLPRVLIILGLNCLWLPDLLIAAETGVVRQPVFAGRFYPADPQELNTLLVELDAQARQTKITLPEGRTLKAVVMPHAGYIYSGWTAAHAGHVLRHQHFAKVVVMAPDHRIGFRNAMISNVDAYQTPLGRIRLHADAHSLRAANDLFGFSRLSDSREHSLEVVLPFLQHYLDNFQLVPIVLGPSDVRRMADAIAPRLGSDTLLVVSSDLSHYLTYDEALAYDRRTLELVTGFEVESLGRRENCACGKFPLQVLLTLAQRLNWEPVLLHYANSGDTAGDKGRVVGYATLAFYGSVVGDAATGSEPTLRPDQGALLVDLARRTITDALLNGSNRPPQKPSSTISPELAAWLGNFVTLETHGRLRGCIGNLVSDEPLHATVPQNALKAAFHDPRFPPLQAAELQHLAVSVSVLTVPTPLDYRNADDLISKLVPHRDGVILQRGRSQATFLPQVWAQMPETEVFLSTLCRKAGLPPDAWRHEKLVIHTYRAQYFNEKP